MPPVSETQSGEEVQYGDILTLPEAAAYLKIQESVLEVKAAPRRQRHRRGVCREDARLGRSAAVRDAYASAELHPGVLRLALPASTAEWARAGTGQMHRDDARRDD